METGTTPMVVDVMPLFTCTGNFEHTIRLEFEALCLFITFFTKKIVAFSTGGSAPWTPAPPPPSSSPIGGPGGSKLPRKVLEPSKLANFT